MATFTERTGTSNPFNGVDVGFESFPTLVDIDGDRDLDAFIGEYDDNINYFENIGRRTSPSFTERTGTSNPFNGVDLGFFNAPTLADIDGDDDLDALVGKYGGSIDYFENTGSLTSPSFTARTGTSNPFNGVDVGGGGKYPYPG